METGYNKMNFSTVSALDPRNSSISQYLYTEIALLDKSNENLKLYQIKDSITISWLLENPDPSYLPEKLFFYVGEVITVDKQKKIIHMENKDIVSYKYLIIANGNNDYREEEYSRGLQTLIEALRIHQKVASPFENNSKIKPKQILQAMVQKSKKLTKISAPKENKVSSDSQLPEGPFFEVQL